MKSWLLSPIALLLCGASALPALAQGPGRFGPGEPGGLAYPASQPIVEQQAGRSELRPARDGSGQAFGPDDDGQRAWQALESRREDRRDRRRDDRRRSRDDDFDDARYGDRHRYQARYEDSYRDRQDSRYDNRRDRRYYVRNDDRRWRGNPWYPQYRYRAPVRYVHPYGYRPYSWRVGHRLPAAYYQPAYYVDHRGHRLPPPSRGYHWVRVDRDVVLVSLASGLIQDILYGLYY